MQEADIVSRGVTIRLQRGGSGPTLLFLHGAGGGLPAESPAARRLIDHVHLMAPDHPGFGRSGEPDWLDNIHDLAYFYLGFIEQLDLGDIHLAGSSLGGWLALEMAVRNPGRFRSLTVFAPAGIKPDGVVFGDPFLWSPEERLRNSFHDQALADAALARPVTAATIETNLKNAHTTARLCWEPRFYDPGLHKWAHLITTPTKIVWGENDRLFPLEHASRVHRLIPGSELAVIRNCGHLAHAEAPDLFASHILDFVRANS